MRKLELENETATPEEITGLPSQYRGLVFDPAWWWMFGRLEKLKTQRGTHMIVAEQKSLAEIKSMLGDAERVLSSSAAARA